MMGFKKNPFYIQRKIDAILRAYRDFVRVYVNGIIIFNHTFAENISHQKS